MKPCSASTAVRANNTVAHPKHTLLRLPSHQHRLARMMKPLTSVQLLFVDANVRVDWPNFAAEAMVDLQPQKLYIALAGGGFEAGLTTAQLAVLAQLFAVVAAVSATCNVVPLIPSIGMKADRVLQFERVSVGGTFDRLHQGHRLLLAATASISTGMVYVGVTADALLASKKGRELLHPYEARCAAALDYMREVHPGLKLEHGPLSDPKAPTLAETDPSMQALVVSQETVPGGLAINQARAARGFAPLTLVVVPLVYRSASAQGEKLSSTQLREQDALQLTAHGAAP